MDTNTAGYLVLENFTSLQQTQELRHQASQLVDGFDPKSISIFSTKNQVDLSECIKKQILTCTHQ